ncbi:coagulation factor XI-like [Plectropomus leopardus]|uniref:coagulation factor XI-like n=1 Tax=Plectropomus leopardus TaxID=160734 RepID=UPI001C4BC670|nr:coagulation factor XI-like [Plectropomus leopardus]
MGTLLVLVGLLCLTGVSMSHDLNLGLCRREFLQDVDFPGSDVVQLFSPDAEHCQLLCTQHARCHFFTFLRADWKGRGRHFFCYLKAAPSRKPQVQKNLQGHTSGFSLKPCNPDPSPCLSRVYHNVDFYGADYRTLFTADYEECQRECTRDPGCQFFTFLEQGFPPVKYRFKCHLKFSWTLPRTPRVVSKPDRVSGFSHKLQISQNFNRVCHGKIFPNIDIPSHDIQVQSSASYQHCQALCSYHPKCTHFSYVSQNFKCYLKSNYHELNKRYRKGITSGLPTRFCHLDTSWLFQRYEGVDFPFDDIGRAHAASVEECQRICDEEPNCQHYTYVPSSHFCYLKRVITIPNPPRVNKLANVVSGFSLRSCQEKCLD